MSLQVLYEFVFSNSEICSAFGIFSCHPRELVALDKSINDVDGMLIVEEGEDLLNPFTFIEQVLFDDCLAIGILECFVIILCIN